MKLIQQILYMSRFVIFGIYLQMIFTSLLIASDGRAQVEKLTNIQFAFNGQDEVSLLHAFQIIEKKTDFQFAYNNSEIEGTRNVRLLKNTSLYEVLADLSKSAGLKFKRINNSIYVSKKEKINANDIPVAEIIDDLQNIVSGTVTSVEEGEPLPGVSILVKGTTQGTTTDLDGKFSLQASEADILQFSFIGYKTQEVQVGNQTTMNIQLEADLEQLEEVIVVGYGTQKKSDVTGSIASVDGQSIARQATVNVSNALQGQVPGVTVVNTSGAPGANSSILIRGQGSYGAIDPLFIVDGAFVSNIDFLEPNDIESLEVLKDASAAAIYGSRAANGVIIVTTKRGTSGKTQVNFTANYGIQKIANKIDFATSQQWRDKEVWMYTNEGDDIPINLQDGNFDPSVSTDWQDVLYRTAAQQNYNLSISGGGENSNFLISGGYTDQEGLVVNSGFDRFNLRANSDFDIGKFKFGESISLNSSEASAMNVTSFRGYPAPVLLPKDANGNYQALGQDWGVPQPPELMPTNPLAAMELLQVTQSDVNIVANIYGLVEILPGLNFRTSASVQYTSGHFKRFTPEYNIGSAVNDVAFLNENRSAYTDILWENTLNYSKSFGKHDLNVVGGWTRQNDKFEVMNLDAQGFPVGLNQGASAEVIQPSSGSRLEETALESVLGRVNYAYAGKYQFTASIRKDATSRLAKDLREGTFPSFSAGWVISEESFFPEGNFINRLKLRGGYGELGRLSAVGPYQVQQTLGRYDFYGNNNVDYVLGTSQSQQVGVAQTAIANSRLLWEKARTTNFALEANFLGDRISLVAEYFIKNTEDLQFGAPLPTSTSGLKRSEFLVNAGDIQNKGFELTLGYHKTDGPFKFNVIGNLFSLKNQVLAFRNEDDTFVGGQYGFGGQDATRAEVGKEMSNFWLLRTDGIFQNQSEIDAHSKDGNLIQPNAKPGDLRFKDLNGDGSINNDDREYIDGSIPDFEYGLNFNASYRNFDLGLIFQGVVGQKLYNGVNRSFENILAESNTDYWRPENPNAKWFRPSRADANGNRNDNDFFLEEAGYFRLRNLQFGYTLPESTLSKLKINSVRFSITGTNLFTITNYSGYDPETTSFGLNRGVQRDIYPLSRTILLGVSANF